MPIREWKCTGCGKVQTELVFGQYPAQKKCECGGTAEYMFGVPIVRNYFRDGFDMGAGRHFNSQRERDNWLSKTNTRIVKD